MAYGYFVGSGSWNTFFALFYVDIVGIFVCGGRYLRYLPYLDETKMIIRMALY